MSRGAGPHTVGATGELPQAADEHGQCMRYTFGGGGDE